MRYPPTLYRDGTEAGQKLGQELLGLELQNALVLAVAPGGVPAGAELARILGAPLDIIIACKIQFPWATEAGLGTVVSDGTAYLGPQSRSLPTAVIEAQTRKAIGQIEHRKKEFLAGREEADLCGKDVILVDDGLATGSTMLAAAQSVKKKGPRSLIVAVPTASATAVRLLEPQVDQLISLYVHPEHLPFAVASSYQNWYVLTDEEVKQYLEESL